VFELKRTAYFKGFLIIGWLHSSLFKRDFNIKLKTKNLKYSCTVVKIKAICNFRPNILARPKVVIIIHLA